MREALEQALSAMRLFGGDNRTETERLDVLRAAIAAAEAALAVKVAVFGGKRYAEAPKTTACVGCAFDHIPCDPAADFMEHAFGGDCCERRVIYIKD